MWKTLTNGDLSSSYTVIAANPLRYMVDEAGIVHWEGGLTVGTSAAGAPHDIFTLPEGFRPRAGIILGVQNNSATTESKVIINATGVVQGFFVASGQEVYFNQTFRAAVRAAYETGTV